VLKIEVGVVGNILQVTGPFNDQMITAPGLPSILEQMNLYLRILLKNNIVLLIPIITDIIESILVLLIIVELTG